MHLIRRITTVMFAMAVFSAPVAAWATATPAPDIIDPHQGETVLTGPNATIITEPSALVEVYEGTTQVGGAIADEAGIWQAGLALGDGTHTIRARALAGDLSWSAYSTAVTFTVDLAPVAPVFTKPANNAKLNNAQVAIEGTATDAVSVTILEGGTPLATDLPLVSGKWATSLTFIEASHTIMAVAKDNRNRTSPAASRTFTVDLTAPGAPVIQTPTEGAFLNSRTVTVSGTAEPGAGITILENTTVRGTTTTNGSGVWTKNVPSVTETTHTYTARAQDGAGNQSALSPGRRFTVDVTAPTVTISTENDSIFLHDEPGLVEGTAGDTGGSVTRVEMHYEFFTGADRGTHDAVVCTGCGTSSSAWSDPPGMMPGYYTVEATAVDRAGNRSATVSITFVQL